MRNQNMLKPKKSIRLQLISLPMGAIVKKRCHIPSKLTSPNISTNENSHTSKNDITNHDSNTSSNDVTTLRVLLLLGYCKYKNTNHCLKSQHS